MQISVGAGPHVSPYVQRYNAFKVENSNFLIRSAIAAAEQAPSAPQYDFGSAAAQWASLGQTIASLKSAWQSGLYGTHRYATVGNTVDTHA